jgi:hypothetical protein
MIAAALQRERTSLQRERTSLQRERTYGSRARSVVRATSSSRVAAEGSPLAGHTRARELAMRECSSRVIT